MVKRQRGKNAGTLICTSLSFVQAPIYTLGCVWNGGFV